MAAEELKATLAFDGTVEWGIPTSGTNTASASFTADGYTIQLASTTNYKQNSGYLILGKAYSTLTLPAFTWKTTKIVVTGRSGASASVKQNIYVGETAVSTETTGATGVNEYVIAADYQAAGNVYVLNVTSGHNTQIVKIEVYGEEASQGGEEPVVEPTTKTIYLNGGGSSLWNQANPEFFVHSWGGAADGDVHMTLVEGDVYKADIPADNTDLLFLRLATGTTEIVWSGEAHWNQSANQTIPEGKDLFTMTSWDNGEWSVYTAQGGDDPEPVDPTPTEKDSIYFVNVAGWAAPRVHLWGGTAAGTEWPGVEMTKLEDQINNYDVYKYVADKGAYVKCIFSDNGENQTADLDWTSGKYFYNDAWYAQNEIPAPVEPQPVDSMTVYYVNETAWENVDAFVWPAEGEAYKAWPGEAMTKEAEQINGFDVYSYTFPASYVNIIFNNGNSGEGNQTSDLVWEEAKPYFYDGAWYAKAGIPTGGDPQEEEFVGFDARTVNLGEQIAAGLAKNLVNVTFDETSTGKYSVNLVEGGVEGSFSFGGVIFAYTNSNAGTTAYKTFGTYIQPNGKDREVRIPLNAGEKANVILTEACEGVLVNGVSTDLVSGDNILTATEDGLVLKTVSTKPKIQAILPVAEPVDSMTVYYVNETAWENVDAFVWPAEGEAYKAWPGEAMTKEAEQINGFDVYSYTFPASYVNIIFNNGNSGEGNQTDNLVWEEAKPYFYDGAWYASLEAIPAPEAPAKFYVTGDSALIADAAPAGTAVWASNAIKSEKDTLVLNLKAGVDYQLSLTVDGTWNTKKTYANLTQEDKSGLYDVDGENHNIGFKLNEPGEVKVVYFEKDEVVTFELIGNFYVAPVDPQEEVTVYFVNTPRWDGVNIYLWNNETLENNAAWPGLAMTKEETKVQGFDVYSYTFVNSKNFDKCIFNHIDQTADLELHAGQYYCVDTWYESIEAIPELDIDEPSPIDPTTAHFYIKHAGNNWTWVEMTYDAVMDAFTYQSVWAGNGANINTVGEDNGNAWYPAAMINVAEDVELRDTVLFAYNYNTKALSVTLVGKYVQKLANGYYIIGLNGWTVDDLSESDDLFYSTGIETGEFSLETTLTEGAVFKVVRVEGDAIINWYGIQTSEQNPDGNYIVDVAHAGEKTIYFRPEWNEDWAGHIYVEPNETTAISNTAADAEAVKVLYNGMLLIRKGNKTYNIMGQAVK